MKYRLCKRCKTEKEETKENFGFASGYMKRICKTCMAQESREYRKKKPESTRASSKKSQEKNREKYREAARIKRLTCEKTQALIKKHEKLRLERFKTHGKEWKQNLINQKKYRNKPEQKEKQRERNKEFKINNQEYFKKYNKQRTETAPDHYIRSMLVIHCKQTNKKIPERFSKELIELKRKQLKLGRWIKENN